MSLRLERYRRRAAECEHAAENFKDPATKALFWDLARQWRELARQTEQLDAQSEEE
jgi:galactokinase